MEMFPRPGLGSNSSRDISNEMKPQPAALGFRVKSGWAAAVLLTGPARSPQLGDVRRIDLSDPRLPETRQPYHAAMGKLETNTTKINRRVRVVRGVAQQSIATLLAGYREKGYAISRAALVVGSQIDPASIANPDRSSRTPAMVSKTTRPPSSTHDSRYAQMAPRWPP